MKKKTKEAGKYILLAIILVAVDQITKQLSIEKYTDFGFFAINYVTNTGITFGLMQGYSNFVIIISFIALGLLYYYRHEFKEKILLTMLVSGIIGNLIDRIIRGHVVDFIDFKFWPVFNIADVLIVMSVFAIIYLELKKIKYSSPS